MPDTDVELHAIFHGNVQGVFFRSHAKEYAESLGLSGTVANCPDGTVELFARGKKESLKRLLEQLSSEQGPGSVNRVEKSFAEPRQDFDGFKVIY